MAPKVIKPPTRRIHIDPDRRALLRQLSAAGWTAADMAAGLGLSVQQVKAWLAERALAKARSRKRTRRRKEQTA